MPTYTDIRAIKYGVSLHRLYPDYLSSPEQLVKEADVRTAVDELFGGMPFADYWKGLDIRFVHMGCDLLDKERAAGLVNLEDFMPSVAGCQEAAGLFFNKDRLDVAVKPKNHTPDNPGPYTLTDEDILKGINTLSHECGHLYGAMFGYESTATFIRKEITRVFNQLVDAVPALFRQTKGNKYELIAELYRAYFGLTRHRGFFSDNVPWKPNYNLKLYTLMRCAYWLQGNLASKIITDFQVWDDRVCWEEWTLTSNWFGQQELRKAGFHCVDHNWFKWRWSVNTSGSWGWVKV